MTNIIGRREYPLRQGSVLNDVRQRIALLDRTVADGALLALLNMVRKETTTNEEFHWETDEFLETSSTIGAAATSTETTLTVDDAKKFLPNQLAIVKRTNEVVHVAGTNVSTNQITVVRAVTASSGGTAAAAIVDGDVLLILGPAVGENNLRQISQTTEEVRLSNFCQIFRQELSFSNRQRKRTFETDAGYDYQMMKQFKEARMSLNRILMASQKGRFTTNEGTTTTTQGIMHVPTTNTLAVGGTLYEKTFNEWLAEEAMKYGSKEKWMLSSAALMRSIHEIAADRWIIETVNFSAGPTEYGIQIASYIDPLGGKVHLVEDRFLTDNYNGTGILIDKEELKVRTFSSNGFDGDLHLISGTQDVDDMGSADTLYADMGLEYGQEKTHAKITGVTGGAKSRSGL